jgi:hypothetical protein
LQQSSAELHIWSTPAQVAQAPENRPYGVKVPGQHNDTSAKPNRLKTLQALSLLQVGAVTAIVDMFVGDVVFVDEVVMVDEVVHVVVDDGVVKDDVVDHGIE